MLRASFVVHIQVVLCRLQAQVFRSRLLLRFGASLRCCAGQLVGADLALGLGLLTCALGVLMAVEPKAAAKITNSLTAGSVEWHTTGGAWSADAGPPPMAMR